MTSLRGTPPDASRSDASSSDSDGAESEMEMDTLGEVSPLSVDTWSARKAMTLGLSVIEIDTFLCEICSSLYFRLLHAIVPTMSRAPATAPPERGYGRGGDVS